MYVSEFLMETTTEYEKAPRFQGELRKWHAPSLHCASDNCLVFPTSFSVINLLVISAVHVSVDSPGFSI